MLACWSCISYISLHQSLYLKKAPTKSFLFSFHLLPLIFSAPGMHRTCCFCLLVLPKFTVWLEMWWPASHPLVSLSGLVPYLEKIFFDISHSGLWAWIFECLQHGAGDSELRVGVSSGRVVRHLLCLCLPTCSASGQGTCPDGLRGLKAVSGRCSSEVEVLNFLNGIFC